MSKWSGSVEVMTLIHGRKQWNDEQQLYEADVWLKQGYYNYQYLTLTPEGSYVVVPTEGNFYQTENQYQALVYYRAPGGRTDRLVGYANVRLTK